MADKNKQEKKGDKIRDLPSKQSANDKAGQVKGGAMRRGGDDDLDDLEVER